MKARTLTLIILLLSLPLAAQEWTTSTKFPIVAGRSAGAIVLGQPVPANASQLYGAPTSRSEPVAGPDGRDTGSVVYGSTAGFEIKKGFLIKLNDGRGDNNVYAIYVRGVRAFTPEGATFGISLAKAQAIYPQGKAGTDELSGGRNLAIPGLTMVFNQKDRLIEMVVHAK